MRVLHTADVHAGIVTHSRTDPDSGLPSALEASLRCFEAVVDIALERSVDAVIVAGDLYHGPNPVAAAILGIDRQLSRLNGEGIDTVLIDGNHDRAPRTGEESVLAVHRDERVYYFAGSSVWRLPSGISVGTLPSFSRQMFGNVSREEAEAKTVDYLERRLGTWAEATEYDRPDIVTGHWPVAGSVLGGETDIAIIDEPMLSPADLEGPWLYAAMGHIHRAQPILSGGRNVGDYSGSVDRFNFGEENYTPSATIIDLDRDPTTDREAVEWVALPARVFRTIDLATPVVGELLTADLVAANEGGIIRIRGRFPEGELHRNAVAMAREMSHVLYDSGASIVYVEVEAERSDRVRVADITEAPTELEALERWISAKGIEPEVAEGLRTFARDLVAETNR
jgi:exonuclease SbcD